MVPKLRDSLQACLPSTMALTAAGLVGALVIAHSGASPLEAYLSVFKGAFGSLSDFGRTLDKTTPLILNGLAVALAFKAGLFNIGTQGQLLFGALTAALVGYSFCGLPAFLHIPLAICAGFMAGGFYGMLQGALKAYTGAHEVITGIMLNYIAINLTDFLVTGPFKDPSPGNIIARTPYVLPSAQIPVMFGLPIGFGLAILTAAIVWWGLNYTTIGFAFDTIGQNPHAAHYSGIKVRPMLVMVMFISGGLAGLGGAIETLGVVGRFQPGFNIGLGFEGITIALLGRIHPLGVVLAAFLLGSLKAGANLMQFNAGVPSEIIDVIIALVLFFVAAETIWGRVFSGLQQKRTGLNLSAGWSKSI